MLVCEVNEMIGASVSTSETQAWDPSLYDNRAAFVSKFGSDLIELLAPKKAERILDLGSGTGDLTARIAEHGAKVLGVDASEEMVSSAQSKFPALEYRVLDGQALPFDEEFSAVFSNAALHWMTRAEDTARGIARALKPGGRLVAEFGGAGCVETVRHAVRTVLQQWGETLTGLPDWYFPSIATYAGLLENVGMSPRSLLLFERPTPMSGESGLHDWLRIFGAPLLARLGSRDQSFVREVSELAAPKLYRDGNWLLDYVRIRVVAVKR